MIGKAKKQQKNWFSFVTKHSMIHDNKTNYKHKS